MAQTSWPFESADTTEAQYSQLFRRLQTNGVAGSPATTDLKVTGDSSGMQVKVAAGYGIVRGHFYNSDAQVTLAIGAAASNPRIDLVVLRLDPTANTITLAVVAGTAAATPAAPAPTQTDTGTFELPIGQVTVPASASTITAGNVADIRPFMGTQFGRWTTATRPVTSTYAPLQVGTAGFNTTTNTPEFWNGTAWSGFTPSSIDASIITSGTLDVARLGTNTITGARIAVGAIGNTELADGSVTNTKVASGIDASKLTTGTLPAAQLPGIDGSKITSGTISESRLPSSLNADGPTSAAYSRSATGSSWYAVWMNSSLQFMRNTSSARYKKNIKDWAPAAEAVLNLRPVIYDRRGAEAPTGEVGFIAEEVLLQIPEAVVYFDGEVDGLNDRPLIAALVSLAKAQDARITALEARLDELGA